MKNETEEPETETIETWEFTYVLVGKGINRNAAQEDAIECIMNCGGWDADPTREEMIDSETIEV